MSSNGKLPDPTRETVSQGGSSRSLSQAPPAAWTGPESTRGDEVRRVLIIDDNAAIHRDFQKLLCPDARASADLDALDAAIFGAPAATPPRSTFQVDGASQGQEGLEKVRRMQRCGRPYALMFVDMRMPPGWDGIETIERIWSECPDIEAVICSAYSDYSWHDVIRRLKRPELRLLSKPFESKDVLELAWSLTSRWLRRAAMKR
ncbi:response regulator transcription factor [Sorangium sp. So ce1078]|uniref:response regulator transcription factor n=1 Tax=Sorangium sp. So ce1078 TaxID=3133329 RepID=UPI003F5E9783